MPGDAEPVAVHALPERVERRSARRVHTECPRVRARRCRQYEVDRRLRVGRLIGRRTRGLGSVGRVAAVLAVALPLRVDDEHDVTGFGHPFCEPCVHFVVRLETGRERQRGIFALGVERCVQTRPQLRTVAVDERKLELPTASVRRPFLGAAERIRDLRLRAGTAVGVLAIGLRRPLGECRRELRRLDRGLLRVLGRERRVRLRVDAPLVGAVDVVEVASGPRGRAGIGITGVLVTHPGRRVWRDGLRRRGSRAGQRHRKHCGDADEQSRHCERDTTGELVSATWQQVIPPGAGGPRTAVPLPRPGTSYAPSERWGR